MSLKVSLCIPTMRRWDFLKVVLPRYLENPFISEIIITDETGEDFDILTSFYKDNEKIKVYKNAERLGAFLNKLTCMSYASNEWICLMDSDNFSDLSYFNEFESYTQGMPQSTMVYCPSFAKPTFDYRPLQGVIMNKESIKPIIQSNQRDLLECAFNTGNYMVHRSVVSTIKTVLETDTEAHRIAKEFCPCDAIYMNYVLLQNGYSFVLVPNMYYDHLVHEGSFYMTHANQHKGLIDHILHQFRSI